VAATGKRAAATHCRPWRAGADEAEHEVGGALHCGAGDRLGHREEGPQALGLRRDAPPLRLLPRLLLPLLAAQRLLHGR
jgi:hypothetical protein